MVEKDDRQNLEIGKKQEYEEDGTKGKYSLMPDTVMCTKWIRQTISQPQGGEVCATERFTVNLPNAVYIKEIQNVMHA